MEKLNLSNQAKKPDATQLDINFDQQKNDAQKIEENKPAFFDDGLDDKPADEYFNRFKEFKKKRRPIHPSKGGPRNPLFNPYK